MTEIEKNPVNNLILKSFSLSRGDVVTQAYILKWFLDTKKIKNFPGYDVVQAITHDEIVIKAFKKQHPLMQDLNASDYIASQIRRAVNIAKFIKENLSGFSTHDELLPLINSYKIKNNPAASRAYSEN